MTSRSNCVRILGLSDWEVWHGFTRESLRGVHSSVSRPTSVVLGIATPGPGSPSPLAHFFALAPIRARSKLSEYPLSTRNACFAGYLRWFCICFVTQGDRFGGALDGAARQFSEGFDTGMAPMEFVNEMRKRGQLIMGIGHRVKSVGAHTLPHSFPFTHICETFLTLRPKRSQMRPTL